VQQFPKTRIFFDRDEIPPGVDFIKKIDSEVGSCLVLLAVIGPQWLTARSANGQRRLDDQSDFVLREITSAVARDIVVIPVLINGTQMPKVEELPDALRRLATLQAETLSDQHWTDDVNRLCRAIAAVPGVGPRREPGTSPIAETAGALASKVSSALGIGATAAIRAFAVTLVCAGITYLVGSNWQGDPITWRRMSDGMFVFVLIYWVVEALIAVGRIRRQGGSRETTPR
jgi:hypothetical protein